MRGQAAGCGRSQPRVCPPQLRSHHAQADLHQGRTGGRQLDGHRAVAPQLDGHAAVTTPKLDGHGAVAPLLDGHAAVSPQIDGHAAVAPQLDGHSAVAPHLYGHGARWTYSCMDNLLQLPSLYRQLHSVDKSLPFIIS